MKTHWFQHDGWGRWKCVYCKIDDRYVSGEQLCPMTKEENE